MQKEHTITSITVDSVAELKNALASISRIRETGAGQPIAIKLRGGDYHFAETIEIGAAENRIIIEPYGNERVRFIGGIRLNGFRRDTYNGHDCLSAKLPACVRPFSDFYVNGKRAAYTRYPAEGYLYPDDVENHEGQLFSGSDWFIAQEGDIPTDLRNPEQVIISFCHYWIDEHTPIEAYDPTTRKVMMRYRSRFNIDGGKGSASGLEYYLENVGETFGNHKNEWYRDGDTVYYIPRDDAITPETIDAYIPQLHTFFRIAGSAEHPAEHVVIRGIDMSVTMGDYAALGSTSGKNESDRPVASDAQAVSNAGGSIEYRYAKNCAIDHVCLTNFGLHGVCVNEGCSGMRFTHMDFYDGGAGGFRLTGGAAGCAPADETYDCTIADCRIDTCGRRYFAACGILMMHTHHCVAAHNEIGNLYYTGISCGWVWGYAENNAHDNRIEKNHIHDLGKGMLSDMGGVYLLGKQPGTVVCGNVIHDVSSRNYGGWALYTDEGSSYMTIEENICYNCSDNCYHQHYGSYNLIRNNIFAFGGEQIFRISRLEEHVSLLLENNIFYSAGAPMFGLQEGHITEGKVPSHNNLFFDTTEKYRFCGDHDIAYMREHGMEDGSIIADPGFADAAHYDFTLPEDSPAYAIGFKKLDPSDVGVRGEYYSASPGVPFSVL